MNIKINKINKNTILKYLHYKGSKIPVEFESIIDHSIEFIRENYFGKYIYRVLGITDDLLREILIGNDIAAHLKSSTEIIMMAVTLGQEVEKHINKLSYVDLTKSVILDSVASAAVESLADDISEKLAEEYKPRFLTDRFSPGYGDMPIEVQKKFMELLNTKSKIGLGVSSSGILQPRKSITAIMGISDVKQKHRNNKCELCNLYRECNFIKRG
jgi:hypothetical protein